MNKPIDQLQITNYQLSDNPVT